MGRFSGVLIATDLDGTLLDNKKQIGKKTLEAVEYFMAEGGYFTVATGRMHQSYGQLLDLVPLNAPVIFANGAQLYDYKTDKILWQTDLDGDSAAFAADLMDKFPQTALEVYRHKESYVYRINRISKEHVEVFKIDAKLCSSIDEIPLPWTKMLFTDEPDVLRAAAEYGKRVYGKANFRFSTPTFLEIFSGATDKGRGVLRLAEMLGVAASRVYTAGDQENDLDMLRAAALSFAPENASAAVKKEAAVILPDNEHDTIASMVEYLGKIV